MATLKCMKYTGIPQVIRKNPSIVKELEGSFIQPFSLMNPLFQVQGEDIQNLLNNNSINYFEVEGKKYYLMDWSIQPDGIIQVRLHLDVLTTYQSEIGKLSVMLQRSSTPENMDIRDNMYPLDSNQRISETYFPREFSDQEEDGTYILVTSQDGYSTVEE